MRTRLMSIRLSLALLLIASISILFIAAKFLQQGDFESLDAVLTWIIAGGGAMVLAGYVVAYLLENIAFWHNLPVTIKTIVPILLAAFFGAVAQSVLALDVLPSVPANVQALVLMLINWLFSQVAYSRLKGPGKYGLGNRG